MNFEELVRQRRSVRHFASKPVARDDIRAIVADAQHAPSWVNAQEWRVWAIEGAPLAKLKEDYVARTAEGRKGNSDIPPAHRETWSPVAQRHMAELGGQLGALGLGETMGQCQDVFFDAPVVLILTLPKVHSEWAMLDLGGFEQTLMLSATARGIGSIPAYNIVKHPDLVRAAAGIPDSEALVVGVALGYEEEAPINAVRTTREPLENVLTFCG